MSGELYWFQSGEGVLTIGPDAEFPWNWELRLNGRVLRSKCHDPQEAALFARAGESGKDESRNGLATLQVPQDLERWCYGDPPDFPVPILQRAGVRLDAR
jgi:hypothetical protein